MTASVEASLWEAAHVPDWVAFIELPEFLQRTFGYPPNVTIPAILPAVKNGSLIHRVAGLEPISSPGRASLPPGYEYDVRRPYRRTYVRVWDLVQFVPGQGTVGRADMPIRYVVEVLWAGAERWELSNRSQWQRQVSQLSHHSSVPGVNASQGDVTEIPASGKPTAASHSRLKEWLIVKMKAAPGTPTSKHEMKVEAKKEGLTFSDRGFTAAWANAVELDQAPQWSAPGRKPIR